MRRCYAQHSATAATTTSHSGYANVDAKWEEDAPPVCALDLVGVGVGDGELEIDDVLLDEGIVGELIAAGVVLLKAIMGESVVRDKEESSASSINTSIVAEAVAGVAVACWNLTTVAEG